MAKCTCYKWFISLNVDGISHGGTNIPDGGLRGGDSVNVNRRALDIHRINNFLYNSPQGGEFLLRQGALQLLNPRSNTRIFNAGVNILAQVAASGITNFKRHGLIPEPADVNINTSIGNVFGDSLLPEPAGVNVSSWLNDIIGDNSNIVDSIIGGSYEGLFQSNEIRENSYSLGDPGKSTQINVFEEILGVPAFQSRQKYDKKGYDSPGVDRLNAQDIFGTKYGNIPQDVYYKDSINFHFEVVNHLNPMESTYIVFRAFIDNFQDNFMAAHNEYSYSGRGEKFYTYNNFTRKIQLAFKIGAQSRHEMRPLYRKLNYLAAQTAPGYTSMGRMQTPYMKFTLGNYFYRLPGVVSNLNLSWNKEYPWEVRQDPNGKDKDMLKLPHILDVSLSYIPIHAFTPNNSATAPFISIQGEGTPGSPNFLDGTVPTTSNTNTGQEILSSTSFTSGLQNAVNDIPIVGGEIGNQINNLENQLLNAGGDLFN